MHIAIATKNKAKLNACYSSFEKLKHVFADFFKTEITFMPMEAESSVSDMPLSLNELLEGARNRAFFVYDKLKDMEKSADFIIGMEGGVFRTDLFSESPNQAMLQNWVYTFNGTRGYYGCSAGIPLPQSISDALYVEKRELAEVIDKFSGKKDVRSNDGAFGILTENLYNRSAAFESAVINATIPFFNSKHYEIQS